MPSTSGAIKVRLVDAAAAIVRPKIGRLCIATTGRTGSDLLVQQLAAHPQMRCQSEVLNDEPGDPLRFLRRQVFMASRGGAKAFGFKLNTMVRPTRRAWDLPSLVRGLADDGFVFVRLGRENRLRQALSSVRARDTQTYHATAEVDAGPMHVDPIDLIALMVRIENAEAALDQMLDGQRVLGLTYEADLEQPESVTRTIGRVCDFIGLDPFEIDSTRLRVTTPRSLAGAVENHEQLVRMLTGTRLERYLFE